MHHRRLPGRAEQGTEVTRAALQDVGFVGEWRKVCATRFHLPQSRPRVWGLFLRRFGSGGAEQQASLLASAWRVVEACQAQVPESLDTVLRRAENCPGPPGVEQRRAERHVRQERARSVVHVKDCAAYVQKHNLRQDPQPKVSASCRCSRPPSSPTSAGPRAVDGQGGVGDQQLAPCPAQDALQAPGRAAFDAAAEPLSCLRERDTVWLSLCEGEKSGRIGDWSTEALLVVNFSDSMKRPDRPRADRFPCVRPNKKFVSIRGGQMSVVPGRALLALQGVGPEEQQLLRLAGRTDADLGDLAGNAFTANVCGAFLLAALGILGRIADVA